MTPAKRSAEKLSGKPGMRWVRGAVLNLARRHQELKQQYFDEAKSLAAEPAQSPPTALGGSGGAGAVVRVPLTPGPSPAAGRGVGDDLFLAEYLQGQTIEVLETNERLALLDLLRPVYQRQPTYLAAMKKWEGSRADLLDQAGQDQAALALRRKLAEQYPKDAGLQVRYATALSGAGLSNDPFAANRPGSQGAAGDLDAAYAWLDRALAPPAHWSPEDEQTLRTAYAELLRSEGRYAELVDYLAAWIKRDPPMQQPYGQYLSALVWADRPKEADETLAEWLRIGQGAGSRERGAGSTKQGAGSGERGAGGPLPSPRRGRGTQRVPGGEGATGKATGDSAPLPLSSLRLPPSAEYRLRAAIRQALGRADNFYTNRVDEKWHRPLADLALGLAPHPALGSLAGEIMGSGEFQATDECRRVRRTALRMLRDEPGIAKLPPDVIARYVEWISHGVPPVEPQEWKKLVAALRGRWEAEPAHEVRDELGSILLALLGRVGPQEKVAFLRRQLEKGDSPHLPERPEGCFAQMGTVPFFSAERAAYARQLFDALLGLPWSQASEDELLGLLDRLCESQEPAERLAAQIDGLLRLTDAMVEARFDAATKKIEHPEKLTRTELSARRKENLRQARQGWADRLRQAAAKAPEKLLPWITVERLYLEVLAAEADKEKRGLSPFVRHPEGTRLRAVPAGTERSLVGDCPLFSRVAEECWELLGPKPAPAQPGDAVAPIDRLLRQRVLATLMHLATHSTSPLPAAGEAPRGYPGVRGVEAKRPNTAPANPPDAVGGLSASVGAAANAVEGLSERAGAAANAVGGLADLSKRLLAYLGEAASTEPDNPLWNALQYQTLIALDRPGELSEKLHQWIDAGDPANYWRLALGYLLAEEGRLKEAAKLFETVRDADELHAADYRALAGWYQVLGRRPEHDRAIIAALKTADEYQISNWIDRRLRPWQRDYATDRQPPPRELDAEVPLAFVALLEKASEPQNYLSGLEQFYHATRDFRLLGALADGMIGHTPGQVYPLLEGLGPLLGEIRDEATLDTLVERLGEVRKRGQSPFAGTARRVLRTNGDCPLFLTPVDGRALDLLELLAERRAAELQDQPGPHAQRALAVLRRAWKQAWSPGEPRLMADLLASLGAISQKDLAVEQVRLLEELERGAGGEGENDRGYASVATAGPSATSLSPADRLHVRHCIARTYWAYDRREQAIDRLTAALAEYRAGVGGRLPAAANEVLETLISCMENAGQYVRAENYLRAELRRPAIRAQGLWLAERLYQVQHEALAHDGEVSLGRGPALYRALEAAIRKGLDGPDQNHRHRLAALLCRVYRTAAEKRLPGVVEDLRKFAFEQLPRLLARQTNGYDEIIHDTAQALHDLAGPRDGLALLVRHAEHQPAWFQFNQQDIWNRHGSTMGQWRQEARELGDLDARLLRVVLAELRRDLRSRQQGNRVMYDCCSAYYWAEKEADFARTAEEVLAASKDSAAAIKYITEYLFHGVKRQGRAIAVLLDAQRREVLDLFGRSQLAQFLQDQNRFAESIPILEPMVSGHPGFLDCGVWLMHAYYKTAQPTRLADLLRRTDEYFHKEDRWEEPVMARLGESCLENALFEQSAAYFREAISQHERNSRNRGIGDGTLSHYYGQMAAAYGGLKKTAEAVDAACAAIVSWGPNTRNRDAALAALAGVLRQAADLDAYLAGLDHQAAASGMENPLVRKAAGQVYRERKQYAKAIAQLRLAIQAQSGDAETHQALLACYDAQSDQPGAIDALLAGRELDRRNLGLYRDLGRRLERLGRPAEAERAFTSIVEMLPAEAESHTLLAEIRQEQNRWAEAIFEWQQAARLRALEPAGLLGLTAAQIHGGRLEDAQATLDRLRRTDWPARCEPLLNEKLPALERALEEVKRGGKPK